MEQLQPIFASFQNFYSDLFDCKIDHRLLDFLIVGDKNLVFYQIVEDNCNVGLMLNESVLESVLNQNPFVALNSLNFEAFLVFTEELSHLIQLLNLAEMNSKTTQEGLERVAEIDKLVVSAALLEQQSGLAHLDLVKKLLMDHSINFAQEKVYDSSPKALNVAYFEKNRFVLASSDWRRKVQKYKLSLLRAS